MRVLMCVTIFGLAVACTNAGSGLAPQPSASAAMKLTGYRSISIFRTSGAVTVALTSAESQHILGLVRALPKGRGPDCHEPPDLVYRVAAAHVRGLVRGTVIGGYRCAAAVSVTVPGSIPSWHTDADCRLDRAIRRLVPSRAEGTRRAKIACR